MKKIYSRINWEDKPSTKTPLSALNLNRMDDAIDKLDDATGELKEDITKLQDLGLSIDEEGYIVQTIEKE